MRAKWMLKVIYQSGDDRLSAPMVAVWFSHRMQDENHHFSCLGQFGLTARHGSQLVCRTNIRPVVHLVAEICNKLHPQFEISKKY